MSRGTRLGAAFAVALAGAWSCMDAADVELLEVSASGVLFGQAFLDLNGNGGIDGGDSPLADVSVVLASPGTGGVIQQVTTDSVGLFFLLDVPVGAYTLALDAAVLGDSLTALGSNGAVTVELGDTARFDLGASYPELTLEEVRTSLPGRRVFTSGIALNPRQANGDGVVFLKGAAAYLRATTVERATLGTGDSVRLLGRTVLDNGQPTLDVVTPLVLIRQAAFPIPVDVTTGVAATADGGPLDAALVRIRNAEISDTSTVNNDFYFWAHDGGDSIQVVFRSFLNIPTAPVRPDTVVQVREATGMLSPFDDGVGNVRWRLLVRAANEIAYLIKVADVAVTTSFDRAQVSLGETVEITVTVQNLGPQTATGVDVNDPIPAALAFLSATATVGSYDEASGLWAVGDLLAGASDTLSISVLVAGAPGVVTNTVQFDGLEREVEPTNDSNDTASADLTIS